jgi:hypothetical protein
VLQHDLAVKRAEAGDFFEIICMPPTPVTIEPRQREFIEQLKKHSSANTFEFVEIGVEGLKTHLQDKLKARKPKPPIPPFIYLIFDPSDQAAIQAVRNELQQSSEVRLPARGGEASKVAEDHVECLKDCDGAVIYYGQADEFWFRTKDRDLLKARGWRQKQLKALVVLDAPETRDKKEYENKLYQVCRYFKNSCDCIPPFLEGF